MKGLDKIIGRIRADAQAEIDAIRAEGEAKAAEVTAAYAAQAEELLRSEAEKARQAAGEMAERSARSDTMDRSKATLSAKQDCIDEAFALAAKKLAALPREQYTDVLAAMAAASGVGDEEIIFAAADSDIADAVVAKANAAKSGAAFTRSAETRALEGGLILKRGDVEVNCAFATQLRLLRQTMAAEVAAILFE